VATEATGRRVRVGMATSRRELTRGYLCHRPMCANVEGDGAPSGYDVRRRDGVVWANVNMGMRIEFALKRG
jgi:hypothetical protein